MVRAIVLHLTAVCLFAASSLADVPSSITVQGKLTDATGAPVPAGVKTFQFRIFNDTIAGAQAWPAGGIPEQQMIATDAAGLWVARVGALSPLDENDFDNPLRWLQITVDGTTLPRIRLVSEPYAFRTGSVDGATGGIITGKVSIGQNNTNSGLSAFVVGESNVTSGDFSTIAGGSNNRAGGDFSFVGGGGGGQPDSNSASGAWSSVVGGSQNVASGLTSFVGGGSGNIAKSGSAAIAGGTNNRADTNHNFIGGGRDNHTDQFDAMVGGGWMNEALGNSSAILGGRGNVARGVGTVIGGGNYNRASGDFSFVGGGGNQPTDSNSALGDGSVVVGGSGNYAHGKLSFVGGGIRNEAGAPNATVSGGCNNEANGEYSTVGGGFSNDVFGMSSVISGGDHNTSTGPYSIIGGGRFNVATGPYSVVAGGGGTAVTARNSANGSFSTVSGGEYNIADSSYSTVSGGTATGTGEAAGRSLEANTMELPRQRSMLRYRVAVAITSSETTALWPGAVHGHYTAAHSSGLTRQTRTLCRLLPINSSSAPEAASASARTPRMPPCTLWTATSWAFQAIATPPQFLSETAKTGFTC